MIDAEGVVKSFGPRTILRGIDMRVETGETLVIIGGSGCGKSTFLKCVIGLHSPDAGKIVVDGMEVSKLKTEAEIANYRRRFGYLFQEGALFDSMTVCENDTTVPTNNGSLKKCFDDAPVCSASTMPVKKAVMAVTGSDSKPTR